MKTPHLPRITTNPFKRPPRFVHSYSTTFLSQTKIISRVEANLQVSSHQSWTKIFPSPTWARHALYKLYVASALCSTCEMRPSSHTQNTNRVSIHRQPCIPSMNRKESEADDITNSDSVNHRKLCIHWWKIKPFMNGWVPAWCHLVSGVTQESCLTPRTQCCILYAAKTT